MPCYLAGDSVEEFCQTSIFVNKKFSRGSSISLNVLRDDRILEGAVDVQYYKNSVNPGPNIWIYPLRYLWPSVDRILVLLNTYCAFQNPVNPQNIQRYASRYSDFFLKFDYAYEVTFCFRGNFYLIDFEIRFGHKGRKLFYYEKSNNLKITYAKLKV